MYLEIDPKAANYRNQRKRLFSKNRLNPVKLDPSHFPFKMSFAYSNLSFQQVKRGIKIITRKNPNLVVDLISGIV